MNEIFDLVAQLLHTEPCVIVPGFGGFVVNRKSAIVDESTGRFCPPVVQIVFNAKLTHNDGLMVQAWATSHHTSISEAGKEVQARVDALTRKLAENGSLTVDGFGTLSQTAQGCSFVSAINQDGFSESYGLQEFYMPALKKQKTSVFAQIKKYASVGVAAALATMLFVPFNTSNLSSNMASFLPATQKTYSATGTLNAISSSATQMENTVSIFAAKLAKRELKKQVDPRFYIVLKRYGNIEDATAFVERYQDKMSDKLTVMTVSDNFYCVTCANTKDPELAGKMMDNVRNNSSFKETFILYK